MDQAWVDERTADLRSKSYDASHIDSITERYSASASPRGDDANKPGA